MALDRNITWLIIKSVSSCSACLKGFFSTAFSLGSFQCPIPLGEEVQEVAETSGFLTPSFIGAHPDPAAGPFKTVSFTSRLLASLRSRSFGEGLTLPQSDAKMSLWGK